MTIASAPLGGGTAEVLPVIWGRREEDYFCLRILTRMSRKAASDLPVGLFEAFVSVSVAPQFPFALPIDLDPEFKALGLCNGVN